VNGDSAGSGKGGFYVKYRFSTRYGGILDFPDKLRRLVANRKYREFRRPYCRIPQYAGIRSRAGRPGHGDSLSWSWRDAVQAPEECRPGPGGMPSRPGGMPSRPRRNAVQAPEECRPGPGGKPSCSRYEDALGSAAGSPAFVCEQIPSLHLSPRLTTLSQTSWAPEACAKTPLSNAVPGVSAQEGNSSPHYPSGDCRPGESQAVVLPIFFLFGPKGQGSGSAWAR
jgi:hypothetical protein